MGISVGLVGLGSFGSAFAELFKRHPLVDRVGLCDREPERIAKFAELESWQDKFDPRDAYPSLDDMCRSDLDALVIITQPWLHAPQCVQAMEAGKHVYSAVPIMCVPDGDEILDWCDKLVETVTRTGMRYMLGETTYYHAETMFCRRMAAEGAFGDFVYAEGEYYHDVDASCNLRRVKEHRLASRSGREWAALSREYVDAGVRSGPMHYPTHSTSGPVCVMDAHALKATCYGFRNRNGDPHFADYAFSNEIALFAMSNGASMRVCECREIGRSGREGFAVFGTRGSYFDGMWQDNRRIAPLSAQPLETARPTVEEMRDRLPAEVEAAWTDASKQSVAYGGHGGSHAFLVHEFVDAVANDRQPAVNIWEAARYMVMGVMAHKSALRDGETLDVPDWGDAPD